MISISTALLFTLFARFMYFMFILPVFPTIWEETVVKDDVRRYRIILFCGLFSFSVAQFILMVFQGVRLLYPTLDQFTVYTMFISSSAIMMLGMVINLLYSKRNDKK